MGRPREAQNAIAETLETHTTLDAALTAQMLVASARIRQGDPDTGIAILAEAAARSAGAHFAVRSEIAFCTALGHWAKREIDVAETFLAQVDARTDIIHALALDLQGWCHTARRDYRRAAESFRATLVRLDRCKARDRALAARAISTLAIYAAELFDRDLARFVAARAQSLDWSSGFAVHRYITLAHQALFCEFAGDTLAAYEFAAQAREAAPTVPFEVLGWGLSSAIARNAGETYCAIAFAKRAQQLVETLDAGELTGEERFSLLAVAENCAPFDPDRAAELFARYWGLAPVDAMLALSGDPRLTADETFIAGVIAQAGGERDRAQTCYRKAFDTFKEIGYVRRAITAGHALLKLADDSEIRCYLLAQLGETSNYLTAALAAADDRADPVQNHPIVASLSRAQREIVDLICLGKTNKEIAQLRNVSEQTIKNILSRHVFRAFGVSSRAALVSHCLLGRVAGACAVKE
jgi:DNA-binding CsgD family transcriptional regulator